MRNDIQALLFKRLMRQNEQENNEKSLDVTRKLFENVVVNKILHNVKVFIRANAFQKIFVGTDFRKNGGERVTPHNSPLFAHL